MMRRRSGRHGYQDGFTIVELMIATLVFSLILVAISVGVVSFTHSYYQGITASTTQNTARDAMDTVTQAIQFSAGSISTVGTSTYCIGGEQFDISLGTELDGTSSTHALYETPRSSSSSCAASGFQASSQELLGKHMRITSFTLTPSSGGVGLYTVHMHVIYGDDDLLFSPSGGAIGTSADTKCKIQIGSQFCAVADLTATVEKRVQ